MSDGTVNFDVGKKVQKRAEEITRKQGIKVVTTINTTNAFADLAKDFTYKKLQENPPQPKELEMSHAAACLLCNPDFAKQCEVQVVKEFEAAEIVKQHLKGKGLWCAHTVQALADVLIERDNSEELIDEIIPLVEKVAQEKGHPGVITRDLFVALGRAAS
jgi:Zn-dependent metalloprotease